jgi:restriction endonuclease S subunit
MYFQSSDVPSLSEYSSVFINKKQAESLKTLVSENQILVTGFGTIGNVRLVSKLQEGSCYANNVCRITTKNQSLHGFIYAFMASKYAKAQLNKNASGSVVRFIEAPGIKKILVPLFPESKQQEIHNLIVESANLRVKANRLLEEAINELEKELPSIMEHKYEKVSLSRMKENGLRMDATTNYTQIKRFYEELNGEYELRTIADMSKTVFTPNIFKRQRTNDVSTGIPFLSGSDLNNFRPSFSSFLSKKMKNIDDYILRNGWIAIQDAGTIGYVTLVNGYLDGVSATNNLVRIIPNEENDNLYIFAFLKTKQGQFILKSQQFGSVQKHIDNNTITNFRIPILNSYDRVKSKVLDYNLKMTESCIKENQAISLVEKEIESWQQS